MWKIVFGQGPNAAVLLPEPVWGQTHVTVHVAVHVEDSVWAEAQCSSPFCQSLFGDQPM